MPSNCSKLAFTFPPAHGGVGAVLAALLTTATPLHAQKYPEKTIRLISPYPTGASQILALLISEKIGRAHV